ncbi:hypothetical protein PENTCL1PPCAC_25258, partial [Pristionchus entomophagus]
ALLFLLLPLLVSCQFGLDFAQIRQLLGQDPDPVPAFGQNTAPTFSQNPAPALSQDSAPVFRAPQVFEIPRLMMREEELPVAAANPEPVPATRFGPTSISITPSKQAPPTVEESLDMVEPHEWSQMTVFVKTGSDGRVSKTLNDRLAQMMSTWIRTTKGMMSGRPITTTTMSAPVEATSTAMPTTTTYPPLPPSLDDSALPTAPQTVIPPTPPPTEFVNRDDLFITKPPKMEVFDSRMPTIVEGWPLGAEFIERNPLIEEDEDQYAPPQTFEEMLKICPMYPETSTMFIHQIVKREYSAGFETRVQCRCGDGSHESFFARKSKPLLTDQTAALDPNFLKSDLIVGRFSCAFPGNICVQTENGIRLRSMDWQAHVYPAVGSRGGWANSYILLMENRTKLEDVDSGKIYLGASQFDGERRKSRLEHSYLRIKSISCDGCLHSLSCQR